MLLLHTQASKGNQLSIANSNKTDIEMTLYIIFLLYLSNTSKASISQEFIFCK